MTFHTLSDLRLYLRRLLSYYEREFDVYSQKVGTLMRTFEKEQHGKNIRALNPENWQKMGMLMVNKKDPLLGTLEVTLESMEEFKVKLARTKEVLTGFDELESVNIPEGSPITLYLRNGVPMRVLFEGIKRNLAISFVQAAQH
jgi:hypothetical protein